jgi:hypothetical protein
MLIRRIDRFLLFGLLSTATITNLSGGLADLLPGNVRMDVLDGSASVAEAKVPKFDVMSTAVAAISTALVLLYVRSILAESKQKSATVAKKVTTGGGGGGGIPQNNNFVTPGLSRSNFTPFSGAGHTTNNGNPVPTQANNPQGGIPKDARQVRKEKYQKEQQQATVAKQVPTGGGGGGIPEQQPNREVVLHLLPTHGSPSEVPTNPNQGVVHTINDLRPAPAQPKQTSAYRPGSKVRTIHDLRPDPAQPKQTPAYRPGPKVGTIHDLPHPAQPEETEPGQALGSGSSSDNQWLQDLHKRQQNNKTHNTGLEEGTFTRVYSNSAVARSLAPENQETQGGGNPAQPEPQPEPLPCNNPAIDQDQTGRT